MELLPLIFGTNSIRIPTKNSKSSSRMKRQTQILTKPVGHRQLLALFICMYVYIYVQFFLNV